MKTSARTITQTTKYIYPSAISLFTGILKYNEGTYSFSEPSLVFKTEENAESDAERVYTLFSQLINYNFQNRNQYFISIEIRSLFQELKSAIDSLKDSSKETFTKLYKEFVEITEKGTFTKNNDYWNSGLEVLRQKTKIAVSNLRHEKNVYNNSFNTVALNSNVLKNNLFKNLFSSKNINKQTAVLKNNFISSFNYNLSLIQKEQWKKEAYEFYDIYKSMSKTEKQDFIELLSVSEADIVSVRNMTKEQWSVFVEKILPLVPYFVRKYDEKINNKFTEQINHISESIYNFTKEQWINFKSELLNSNIDLEKFSEFFKFSYNQNEFRWKEEKQNFIDFVNKNKNVELINNIFATVNKYKSYDLNNSNDDVINKEVYKISSDLTEWVTYLNKDKWEEVKTVLNENADYIKPVLETAQNKKTEKVENIEPGFSSEKRSFIEYITQHPEKGISIIRHLTEKEEIKKDIKNWVDLEAVEKLEERKTILKNIEEREINKLKTEETEKNTLKEVLYKRNKEITEVNSRLTEWVTYLNESQWEEVKTVLIENADYVKPVLETAQNKKTEKVENNKPEFSSEKRSFIEYITQHPEKGISIIRHLTEKEEIKKDIKNWVDLQTVEKLEERKTLLENIEEREINKLKTEETEKNTLKEVLYKRNKEITEVNSRLTEWVSYLDENQWEEVKTVLNENADYIKPVLETVQNKKTEKVEKIEPEFSSEKRSFIEYITQHPEKGISIIRHLTEKEEIKKDIKNWVDLQTVEKLEDRKTILENIEEREINKLKTEETEKNNLKEVLDKRNKEITEVNSRLTEWVSYLNESQWEEVKTVLIENADYVKPVLETVQNKKTEKVENNEPEFSSEKRSFIEYITQHPEKGISIIRHLTEKEEIKKDIKNWVDLEAVDKLEERKTLLENIDKREINTEETEKNTLKEVLDKRNKEVTEVNSRLTEWVSYLNENQWEEVKTVLNENADYIKPVLETAQNKKTEKVEKIEPEFSSEKRRFIEYITQHPEKGISLIRHLTEKEDIKNWIDLQAVENLEENADKVLLNFKNNKYISSKNLLNNTLLKTDKNLVEQKEKINLSRLVKWITYYNKNDQNKIINNIDHKKYSEYINPVLENVISENSEKSLFENMIQNKKNANENIIDNNFTENVINNLSKKNTIKNNLTSIYGKQTFNKIESLTFPYKANINHFDFSKNLNNKSETVSDLFSDSAYISNNFNNKNIYQLSSNNLMFNNAYKNRQTDKFNVFYNKSGLRTINRFNLNTDNYNQTINNQRNISYLNGHNESNKTVIEINPYKSADLVVAKNNAQKAVTNNPPKMPDVTTEVKKALKTEVNDIIKLKRTSQNEQLENKTVNELINRINLQQKEIDKILMSQKQMIKITDISVVTEKVMNQMQSQLRLEKMRRGL